MVCALFLSELPQHELLTLPQTGRQFELILVIVLCTYSDHSHYFMFYCSYYNVVLIIVEILYIFFMFVLVFSSYLYCKNRTHC